MGLQTIKITIDDFEKEGITVEHLKKYYRIKSPNNGSMVIPDVTTLDWRVVAGVGFGVMVAACHSGPEVFGYSLFSHKPEHVTQERAIQYAVKVIVVAIGSEVTKSDDITKIDKLFEAYPNTRKHLDRIVVPVGIQYLTVYKPPRYTKMPDDFAALQTFGLVQSGWLYDYLLAVYPKEIAEALHKAGDTLYKSFHATHGVEPVMKFKLEHFPAGSRYTFYLGSENGYGYVTVYNSIDEVSNKLEIHETLHSMMRDFT